MRERHPIDECFRQALYHGEADPPEAVRGALGTQLGWTAAPQTSGSWWSVMILAVGLVSTGATLWAWQDGSRQIGDAGGPVVAEQPTTPTVAQITEAAVVAPSRAVVPTTPVDQGKSSTTRTTSVSIAQRNTATEDGSVESHSGTNEAGTNTASASTTNTYTTAGTKFASDPSQGNTQPARSNTGGAGTSLGGGTTLVAVDDRGNEAAASATGPIGTGQEPAPNGPELFAWASVADRSSTAQDLRAIMIDPLRIAPDALVPSGTPTNRALPPNYVLPSGTWWIGPYAGIGTVQGVWKGTDAAALQKAEQWRSTAQGGLLLGREWRSGWGVSAGLGVARVRSTFQHEDATQSASVLDVDTVWATTMHTNGDILYNWQIDSLLEELPSGSVRKDARNLYTAVQIPIILYWHAHARRLRYGAFGGVTAWIPTQRKGLTLVRVQQDAPPTTLALQDPLVNDRFSTQIHGMAGVSVGYTITEQLSAYVEPMLSAPLFSFNDGNTPWLTRPLLQFRIHYELRNKGR